MKQKCFVLRKKCFERKKHMQKMQKKIKNAIDKSVITVYTVDIQFERDNQNLHRVHNLYGIL